MPTSLEHNAATITRVADAVIDVLNGGEFFEDLAESREVQGFDQPEEALAKVPLGRIRIAVLKEAARRTRIARKAIQIDCDISVAILRKLAPTEDIRLAGDRMHALAEELARFLETTPLPGSLNARHLETTIRLLYSPQMLRDARLYMLPTTYTYRVFA